MAFLHNQKLLDKVGKWDAALITIVKHFLGYTVRKSQTLKMNLALKACVKLQLFALLVKEELQSWPEQSNRCRGWLTIPEAIKCCR
ncbi:hypothetical protein RJ641_025557 [Dillenia turbinata]|uniref:Uncharacterized protein n=1 Tax=Dillenia turbinata TaxID=194707 RepID=A0AAN8W355_9MAGN